MAAGVVVAAVAENVEPKESAAFDVTVHPAAAAADLVGRARSRQAQAQGQPVVPSGDILVAARRRVGETRS